MNNAHIDIVAQELTLKPWQVQATAELLAGEATVPFIARYRKEVTGSLDEVAITTVRDRLEQLAELDKRRESILKSLEERNLLTDDLKTRVLAAANMTTLEDIYLPFRPKRRTRATMAKEKGLEPLAVKLMEQDPVMDIAATAGTFIDPEKGVATIEEALAGARDIIAELVSEDQKARESMRALFENQATFRTAVVAGQEEAGAKFRDYFDWEEPVKNAPSHRVLAMRRGETEGVLTLRVRPPEDQALALLENLFVKGDSPSTQQVRTAVQDGYRRLLSLSMETEIRLATKKRADTAAIRVFADNLRELLLAPPLGQQTVVALDPGFRTGVKVVCLDPQGKLLEYDTIFIFGSEPAQAAAAQKLALLISKHQAQAVAIGNGTASRETEAFVRALPQAAGLPVIMVNESGASVYSASEVARAEFPDLDVTVRGAVSIGRRLTDPLAELVKIDPKSIGVGQYQHDVNQKELKTSLDDVVMSCVNAVGVEVNTASEQLLTYVSGLGPQLARNIVGWRHQNGAFKSRQDFLKVPRLGPKAFEQAAGFLRLRDAQNPLDTSAVHPESYYIVTKMAADVGGTVRDLLNNEALRQKINLDKYVDDKVGRPTLLDIMAELAKPGRDPRRQFTVFRFAEGVEKIADLKSGMRLPGIVTNVTAFGAFVDIGVHQDGLVHISQMSDRYVSDPHQVVKVHQEVMVTVLEVDLARSRISLSMKTEAGGQGKTGGHRAPGSDRDQREKKAAPKDKRPSGPFNNPFAQKFKK